MSKLSVLLMNASRESIVVSSGHNFIFWYKLVKIPMKGVRTQGSDLVRVGESQQNQLIDSAKSDLNTDLSTNRMKSISRLAWICSLDKNIYGHQYETVSRILVKSTIKSKQNFDLRMSDGCYAMFGSSFNTMKSSLVTSLRLLKTEFRKFRQTGSSSFKSI